MAQKDTIQALMRRDVSEEVANFLVTKFRNLGEISEAGTEGLVEAGLTEEKAEDVIAKVGKAPSRKKKAKTSETKTDSGKASDEAEAKVSEDTEKITEPLKEVWKDREYTATEKRLFAIQKEKCTHLSKKVIVALASRIENANLDDATCEKLILKAEEMYKSHMMDKNESAGVMAAHSIGEPGTQMNLRTFHFAGVANINVTQGLPRLIEIVDARRDPSTPSMTIPLSGFAAEDEKMARYVASNIEITSLLDVAEIDTDVTNMRIVIHPNASKMDDRKIDPNEIVGKLNKIKAVRGMVKEDGYDIIISSDVPSFKKLQKMYEAVKDAKLKGVDGISRAVVIKDRNTGQYGIVTEGSNLKDVLSVEGVDTRRVSTNSIVEVESVLGIEAARNSIINEATNTLREAGLDVDVRHIMLVADVMTNDGTVRAIGRHGVSGKKASVLARAAFEITTANLLNAAMVGESDPLEGVAENIIVGQPVTLGTGAVDLVYEPKKEKNNGD